MKILFVDNNCEGHHLQYLKALVDDDKYESYFILPKYIDGIDVARQNIFSSNIENKNIINYVRYIIYIRKIARRYKVDIIHFLSIDPIVKYFGFLLNLLNKEFALIATFHHFRYSNLRDYARKVIFKLSSYGIVHTKELFDYASSRGIKNCLHIEYPYFGKISLLSQHDCKADFGILDDGTKVILALGGTRYNKGLDILLKALQNIDAPFYLLVAGKEDFFKADYIKKVASLYINKVRLKLNYLDDDEVEKAIISADIIVLPYRKVFDGASGPLVEGVMNGKMIIGPDHGSLGNLIINNHLGKVFKSENELELSKVISAALENTWIQDEVCLTYRNKLDPLCFKLKYMVAYILSLSR